MLHGSSEVVILNCTLCLNIGDFGQEHRTTAHNFEAPILYVTRKTRMRLNVGATLSNRLAIK